MHRHAGSKMPTRCGAWSRLVVCHHPGRHRPAQTSARRWAAHRTGRLVYPASAIPTASATAIAALTRKRSADVLLHRRRPGHVARLPAPVRRHLGHRLLGAPASPDNGLQSAILCQSHSLAAASWRQTRTKRGHQPKVLSSRGGKSRWHFPAKASLCSS